jgi:hypothetical protein
VKLNRRDFIKANAVAAALSTAGLPGASAIAAPGKDEIRWDKAPCRFCGTGCSVLVGTQGGQVVATQGDPEAPVNRGLNCIKGYFLSKIMYGEDRLKTPMLRMKDGKFDKNGEFAPITWKQAFDIMEEKAKATLKAKGPNGLAMFGSGQWTVWEGYAAAKLMKAGFRTNNLDPNARHCMASAVAGFMRTFGIDEAMRWKKMRPAMVIQTRMANLRAIPVNLRLSPSRNTRNLLPTTPSRKFLSCLVWLKKISRHWPSSMLIQRSRLRLSGPWASISTPVVHGPTIWSITSTS